MDPVLKHDIVSYGDSIVNADLGRQMQADGQNTSSLRAFGFNFVRNERPWDFYRKQKTQSMGGKANLLYQIGKHHEVKAGGEFTYYTVRRYSLSPVDIAQSYKAIADGDPRGIYDRLDNYGYDIIGNKIDSGDEGPKHPVFAAGYIQDKMEFDDLVLNVGFRLDYIDTDTRTFADPSNVQFDDDGIIDPESMVEVDPLLKVSPRLGFSFPVTDRTVFHAQYGKFVQQSRLRDVYLGFNRASDVIKGGFAESNPVGYGIRPERTTAYEIGFSQQLGESFAFDITGFYKDIKDQVQLRPIFASETAAHSRYYAFVNGDFGTVKGIEFKMDLRRTERLSANVDYTYSDAKGTGSTPNTAFRTVWQSPTQTPYFPQIISPTTFNQTHKGSINLDYRFGEDDGPELLGSKFLSRFGANVLFTFTSGFNYTRWDGFANSRIPNETLNASSTPWTFQLDARIDKSFSLGPLNMNVYLWVTNLLDTKNIVDVFNTSGDAYDDGFLATDNGKKAYEGFRSQYGEDAANLYRELYLADIYDPTFFGPPRQIRLGIKLEY
jgi:outer membrane receptor for Fe3+-dicitrate